MVCKVQIEYGWFKGLMEFSKVLVRVKYGLRFSKG